MRKMTILILAITELCFLNTTVYAQRQTSLLEYLMYVRTSCERFESDAKYYSRELTYLGETNYTGDGAIHVVGNEVKKYLAHNVWGHGDAYVYVECVGGDVSFIEVEFLAPKTKSIGKERLLEAAEIFNWGNHVFEKSFGSPQKSTYDDVENMVRNGICTWSGPDGVEISCVLKIDHNIQGNAEVLVRYKVF